MEKKADGMVVSGPAVKEARVRAVFRVELRTLILKATVPRRVQWKFPGQTPHTSPEKLKFSEQLYRPRRTIIGTVTRESVMNSPGLPVVMIMLTTSRTVIREMTGRVIAIPLTPPLKTTR